MNWIRATPLLLLGVLFLAGCNTTNTVPIFETKTVVISPPDSLYNCPQPKLPTTAELKNKDVGTLIAAFYQANRTCKIAEANLRNYINQAKVIYK
jgi:hypothetical protein